MFRRLVPMIGLFAAGGFVLLAAPAQAQVNIDQGKSAAEMFSGDCATCHKSAKGLANGRGSSALAGFLREHYTSSAEQASALAAYVLGAGSGPSPSANLKPGTGEQKTGEAKGRETKPDEKTRPGRPEPASAAKLQQPSEQDTKIEAAPPPSETTPARKPAAGKHEPRSATASRGSRRQPETPPHTPEATPVATPEPAPVATAPPTPEPANSAAPAASEPAMPVTAAVPGAAPESGSEPKAMGSGATAPAAAAPSAPASDSEASPSVSASAPAEAPAADGAPADNTPVPRDDIPD